MPEVVKLGGGGSKPGPKPSHAGGDGGNKTLLIVGLSAAIILGVGVAIYNVVPHAPPPDAMTATDLEKRAEDAMSPEERERKQRQYEGPSGAGASGTDSESPASQPSSGASDGR
jgi:hypothetical protein